MMPKERWNLYFDGKLYKAEKFSDVQFMYNHDSKHRSEAFKKNIKSSGCIPYVFIIRFLTLSHSKCYLVIIKAQRTAL
jgi:hypothetical protein